MVEPNVYTEGGLVDVQTPPYNSAEPIFKIIPYKGLTAAKVAPLVNKQVD